MPSVPGPRIQSCVIIAETKKPCVMTCVPNEPLSSCADTEQLDPKFWPTARKLHVLYKAARAESDANKNSTTGPVWKRAVAAAESFSKDIDFEARKEKKKYGQGPAAATLKKLDELLESSWRTSQLLATIVCHLLLFRFSHH